MKKIGNIIFLSILIGVIFLVKINKENKAKDENISMLIKENKELKKQLSRSSFIQIDTIRFPKKDTLITIKNKNIYSYWEITVDKDIILNGAIKQFSQ